MRPINKFSVILLFAFCLSLSAQYSFAETQTGLFGMWEWNNYDQAFGIAKNNGFKVVACGLDKELLDKAYRKNLKVLGYFGLTKEIASDPRKWNNYVLELKKKVTALKGHPALYAYYFADEPDGNDIPVEKIAELRSVLRSIDAVKPIFGVFDSPKKWTNYLPYFDIVCVDPYFRRGIVETTDQSKEWLVKVKADLKKMGKSVPVWVVLGAFDLQYKDHRLTPYIKPTPAQLSRMLDDAIQQKVDGIMVYTLANRDSAAIRGWKLPVDDPGLWAVVRSIPARVSGNQRVLMGR